MIVGMRLFGLTARKGGANCTSLPSLIYWNLYGNQYSSCMMVIFHPFCAGALSQSILKNTLGFYSRSSSSRQHNHARSQHANTPWGAKGEGEIRYRCSRRESGVNAPTP